MSKQHLICLSCSAPFAGKVQKSFLGIRKFVCPSCQLPSQYPMTRGYQIAFIGAALFFVAGFLMELIQGKFWFAGLIGAGAAVAGLAADQRLRGAVAARVKP